MVCFLGNHDEAMEYIELVDHRWLSRERCARCDKLTGYSVVDLKPHYWHITKVHRATKVNAQIALTCNCDWCREIRQLSDLPDTPHRRKRLEALAELIAKDAHSKQLDKSGAPYIYHVKRVALKLWGNARIAGWLHDVVEDTPVSLRDIERMLWNPDIIDAIHSITRMKNEKYKDYILRVKQDPLATEVKIADLEDNLERCRGIFFYSLEKRYKKAYKELTGKEYTESYG